MNTELKNIEPMSLPAFIAVVVVCVGVPIGLAGIAIMAAIEWMGL